MTPSDAALVEFGQALMDFGYRFTTVTPATHARVNGRLENAFARTVEDVFGWSRPFAAGVLNPQLHRLAEAAGVVKPQGGVWRPTLRASTVNEALFFHSAYPTTAADAVFFGPDTYRFLGALAQHLRNKRPVRRAVDIGCGAGPGAIWIAGARPDAEVIAVDINDAALRMTAVNATLAGATTVLPKRSDLLSSVEGTFDLIVANPPYLLDSQQRAYRHGGGTLGEGLSLSIAEVAAERLEAGGTLLLYTGSAIVRATDRFREAILDRLTRLGLEATYREIDPDVFGEELAEPAYASVDRIAVVEVIATR